MKKSRSSFVPILVFVLAQIAWVSLLLLWIYWFVTNYLILSEVGDRLAVQLNFRPVNIVALVSGLVLLVGISFSLSLIFRYFARQASLTRSYDTFIANITHELKSPLASIRLYLETMRDRDVSVTKQKEFYRTMIKDADRLRRLIDSILEISGLEVKQYLFEYEIHDADILFRGALVEALEQLNMTDRRVTIEGGTDCRCLAARDAMRTVFVNLLDNAAKYSQDELSVQVRLSCDGKWIRISIADNGIGIAAKDQKAIFAKFQRIENPLSPNVKGTGLGLFWVREIVRQHGGRISVESRGPGYGSTFSIMIPAYTDRNDSRYRRLLRHMGRRDDERHG